MYFISILSIFVLACFVGYHVVCSAAPALHALTMAGSKAMGSLIAVGLALIGGGVATAAPLYSVWQLQPMGQLGELRVTDGDTFLQQRLVPYRLVRLIERAQWSKRSALEAGTYLFAVWQDDGKLAWCTAKDQSNRNAAKSLFIPMLDRRPCLVDNNADGRFESVFTVFDKYGSALTPSGNLSSAKAMVSPAAYSAAPSSEFPVVRTFAYSLVHVDDPARRTIAVTYDNGRVLEPMVNGSPRSTPDAPAALNLVAAVVSVQGKAARIIVTVAPGVFLVGDSSGTFGAAMLPSFVQPEAGK